MVSILLPPPPGQNGATTSPPSPASLSPTALRHYWHWPLLSYESVHSSFWSPMANVGPSLVPQLTGIVLADPLHVPRGLPICRHVVCCPSAHVTSLSTSPTAAPLPPATHPWRLLTHPLLTNRVPHRHHLDQCPRHPTHLPTGPHRATFHCHSSQSPPTAGPPPDTCHHGRSPAHSAVPCPLPSQPLTLPTGKAHSSFP